MGLFGPYIFKPKKSKKKFYLHMRERGKSKIYFFSEDPTDALKNKPKGYDVVVNKMIGQPFLKKKSGGLFGGKQKQENKEEK